MWDVTVFRDVTGSKMDGGCASTRKCCEKGVLPVAERLQALEKVSTPLAEHLSMGVAYLDRTLRFWYFNQAYADMMRGQCSGPLMPGAYLPDVIGMTAFRGIEAELGLVLAGIPAYFTRSVLQDGQLLMLETRYLPDTDSAGEVSGFYSILSDVTRELATSASCAWFDEILRGLIANMPQPCLLIDREERVQFYNDACIRVAKMPVMTIQGVHVRRAMGREYYGQYRQPFRAALAGIAQHAVMRLTENGKQHDYQATYRPHEGKDGEIAGVWCSLVGVV